MLAIFLPNIGYCSETFLMRHVLGLYPPEKVVVVTLGDKKNKDLSFWSTTSREFNCHEFSSVNDTKAQFFSGSALRNKLASFLISCKVKVALLEYLNCFIWCVNVLNALDIKVFAHGHGFDVSASEAREEYAIYNCIEKVFTMSNYSKRKLIACGVSPHKIVVKPYGLPSQQSSMKVFKKSSDELKLLAVGRMVEKKNPLGTIKSIETAIDGGAALRLDFIGHGPLYEDVCTYVKSRGLNRFIHLHKDIPHCNVLEYMKISDIFIQHSVVATNGDEEGLPNSIIEGLAHSLPVISTRHSGIPEIIINHFNGILSDQNDIIGMARSILYFFRNRDQVSRMGFNAYKSFVDNLTWEKERQTLCHYFDKYINTN